MKQHQNKGAVIKGLAFPIGYTAFMNVFQIGLMLIVAGICLARALLALIAVPEIGINAYVEHYMTDYAELLNSNTFFLSVLSTVTALLILWFVFNRRGKSFTEYFRFTPAPAKALIAATLIGLSMFFLTNTIMTLLEQALFALLDQALLLLEGYGVDIAPITDYLNALLEAMSSMYDGVGMFTVAAIVGAPIIEELVFRAGPLTNLTKKMPAFAAVMLTSALFALAHGNPLQMIYTFVLGIFCAYLFIKTDSIYPSMLCHFVFNGANLIALLMQALFRTDLWEDNAYYLEISATLNTWSTVVYWVYLITTVLIAIPMLIVGILLLVKLRRPASEPTATQEEIEQILYDDEAQMIIAAPSLASQADTAGAIYESPESVEESVQNSEADA